MVEINIVTGRIYTLNGRHPTIHVINMPMVEFINKFRHVFIYSSIGKHPAISTLILWHLTSDSRTRCLWSCALSCYFIAADWFPLLSFIIMVYWVLLGNSVQGYVAIFEQLGIFAIFFTPRVFGIFTPLTLKLELVPFFSSHSLAEIQDGRHEIQFFNIFAS